MYIEIVLNCALMSLFFLLFLLTKDYYMKQNTVKKTYKPIEALVGSDVPYKLQRTKFSILRGGFNNNKN